MEADTSIWQKPGHFYFALTHTARLGYVGRDYKKPLEAIAEKQRSSGTKAAGS